MLDRPTNIGVGAGFSDDRLDPALELVTKVRLDYLVFECLAERTIARETLTKSKHPELGYSPTLEERIRGVLVECLERKTRIVTNMGAANPLAAAKLVRDIARDMDCRPIRTAAIVGDAVEEVIRNQPQLLLLEGEPLESILPRMVSANAYLGADLVHEALLAEADVVVGGRIADPSLFLGCMLHAHGWSYEDYGLLAAGTLVGHLLECSAQLSGGCFADPGLKDVPGMARIGFPYAAMSKNGSALLGKAPGSGGLVSVRTCKEQALYELHDPGSYITPDCVLDISEVEFRPVADNVVSVSGARARPRTDTYKVVVGYNDGWIGTGEIGYAGPNAMTRATLAEQTIRERIEMRGLRYEELRVDYIGISSLHGSAGRQQDPYEVRLRIAGRSASRKVAEALGFEIRTMHVNGPAGGGGGSSSIREVLAVKSLLLPRAQVHPRIVVEDQG